MQIWFDVLATQMPIFVLFVSAGVLFDGAFSLWVSLMKLQAILGKGDSTKGVFLRSFRNFKNTLFCRTTAMAASEAQKTRQHTIPWYISQ